ncbi:hypothetical protein CVT24_005161 [Panaeolus cyanescens]|uniref:Allergen n=1 Tax=Panaeolus cyanescens TaxID=181874 RepID=A0A409Y8Z5_9AGAR|nr:hypothetical protein CVT24_005161 [Panaeolus cyanescens]
MKHMLSNDAPEDNADIDRSYSTTQSDIGDRGISDSNTTGRGQRLPPGRGVGTSGRSADPAVNATDNITSNVPGHYQETSAVPPDPPKTGSFFRKTSKADRQSSLSKQPSHHQTAAQAETSQRAHEASERMVQHDAERAKTVGVSGYGTDAAAAAGGDLGGTHQYAGQSQSGRFDSYVWSPPERETYIDQEHSDRIRSTSDPSNQPLRTSTLQTEGHSHATAIREAHTTGHTKSTGRDVMPSGKAEEDTNQLEPVTHEHIRHLETEEIGRVTEHERHVHHIQHHTQPIIASEELPEQRTEVTQPVTHISETHVNKPEDKSLFEGQVHQHVDTLSHSAKERTIIDKGNTVHETVHHHVHHIIQPVIEKETIDKKRIHTTIPVHEVTHEAPVVHQSQAHAPIPLEHFLQKGGTLEGAVSQDRISEKVLHQGTCTRDVEGVAEDLERDLHIGDRGRRTTTTTTTTTDVDREYSSPEKLAAKRASERASQHTVRTQTVPKN